MQRLDLLSHFLGGVILTRQVGRFHGGNTPQLS